VGCWRKAGSVGHAAAFSFYPGKNLGACGEAGAVTTNDAELAQKVRMLRDHGQAKKYYHEMEGYNGRLDAIQAGILLAKLKHLLEWNVKRREAARRYSELFASLRGQIGLPYEPIWAIGTGVPDKPEESAAMAAFIKLKAKSLKLKARVLYGGSVKPSNAKAFLSQKEIGGALVGGASLNAKSFRAILRAAQ
jgi:dTDP-4-amino-4,6-dideoxygalactose transaminase